MMNIDELPLHPCKFIQTQDLGCVGHVVSFLKMTKIQTRAVQNSIARQSVQRQHFILYHFMLSKAVCTCLTLFEPMYNVYT